MSPDSRSHSRRSRSAVAFAALVLSLSACVLSAGCGPSDPIAEVRELFAAGRFADAVEPLRALIEARPEDAEVHYLYGVALARSGQTSLAQWPFRKAMADPEWLVPSALQLGAGALMTGNHEAAIEAAGRILERESDNVDALVLRARARVDSRRDYEGALADADRALELDPDSVDALVPRALALLGLERAEEAEIAMERLEGRFREVSLVPGNTARYCVAQAIFARERGDAETAERRYEGCLKEFPASALVISEAIEFYDGQGRFEHSLQILRKALETAPGASAYRRILAGRLRAMGEVAEAERILRDGTESEDPQVVVSSWADLGGHYLELEDYEAAAKAMERAMEVAGDPSPQMVFAYADTLVMAGRYEEALEIARGMEIPAQRELVFGRALLAQGRPAEALERLTAGLLLWPNNAVARYYAARAAEQVGDFDRAIAEYRYSIRSDPEATDASLRLVRLHEAEGAYGLALAIASHRTTRDPAAPDLELELVALRVAARVGRLAEWRGSLGRLVGRPGEWARAVAAVAQGARDRLEPGAAANQVQEAEHLDLTDPQSAPALRVLVADLVTAGRGEAALRQVEGGLAAHPDAAVFHEIRGLALAGSGAPAEEVRAAYQRAVDLDAGSARALAGLAEWIGDPESALSLYARAAAADPEDSAPQRAAAELLISLGRSSEAERQLTELLREHPYDAGAARLLAGLLLDGGGQTDRALELARRAVRFGGGPEAAELLSRAERPGGEPERAAASPE